MAADRPAAPSVPGTPESEMTMARKEEALEWLRKIAAPCPGAKPGSPADIQSKRAAFILLMLATAERRYSEVVTDYGIALDRLNALGNPSRV